MNFLKEIENNIRADKFWIKGQNLVDDLDIEKQDAFNFILHAEKHKLLKKSFQGECPNCGNFMINIKHKELSEEPIIKECDTCFKTVEVDKDTIEIILYFNLSLFKYIFQENNLTEKEKEEKKYIKMLFGSSQESGITNNQKGKRFEEFSKELLKTVQGFEFIFQNKFTETSEIDIIFTNNSSLFNFKQGDFLVQSKNQKKTTDINAVCHLVSDMLIRNIELGFIISSTHISKNAYTRIAQHFIKNNIIIIVIEMTHIESFFNNMNMVEIIKIQNYDLKYNRI